MFCPSIVGSPDLSDLCPGFFLRNSLFCISGPLRSPALSILAWSSLLLSAEVTTDVQTCVCVSPRQILLSYALPSPSVPIFFPFFLKLHLFISFSAKLSFSFLSFFSPKFHRFIPYTACSCSFDIFISLFWIITREEIGLDAQFFRNYASVWFGATKIVCNVAADCEIA